MAKEYLVDLRRYYCRHGTFPVHIKHILEEVAADMYFKGCVCSGSRGCLVDIASLDTGEDCPFVGSMVSGVSGYFSDLPSHNLITGNFPSLELRGLPSHRVVCSVPSVRSVGMIGSVTIPPFSSVQAARAMRDIYVAAIDSVFRYGKPFVCVSMICSIAWSELLFRLLDLERVDDRGYLNTCLIRTQLRELCIRASNDGVRGSVAEHIYVVELREQGFHSPSWVYTGILLCPTPPKLPLLLQWRCSDWDAGLRCDLLPIFPSKVFFPSGICRPGVTILYVPRFLKRMWSNLNGHCSWVFVENVADAPADPRVIVIGLPGVS